MSDVERIIEELRPLAEKLGDGAVEVYKLAVRQAIARGVGLIMLALAFLAATVIALGVVRKCRTLWVQAQDKGRYEGEGYLVGGVVAGVVAAVCTGTTVGLLYSAMLILINPKWAAVGEILRSLP